jgi:23S rRNA (uracil1939-C5)-methyltransferase
MLSAGDVIQVAVDKPAAGGRMIARHDGRVVLVLGAIPGERVDVRVERVEKRLAFGSVVRVEEGSGDRRAPTGDVRCGGCLYAHIDYARQLALKSEVIGDAFARIGRLPLESVVPVAASPELGHRMRARLHVASGRAGFYLEGTHEICDPRETGQLLPATVAAIDELLRLLTEARISPLSIEVAENVAADERAFHIELVPGVRLTADPVARLSSDHFNGCVLRTGAGELVTIGTPMVSDPLATLTSDPGIVGRLARRPGSFFQANRFVVPQLVTAVSDAVVVEDEPVLDLYAGVGLFSVSLAARRRAEVTAVEGDGSSAADLRTNAASFSPRLRTVARSVEDFLAADRGHYYTPHVEVVGVFDLAT